jgi:ribosomal protein S18 acetylase RimI-like enzyme
MKELIIRHVRPEDFTAVHKLIHELAVFEKEPDQHVITPQQYLQDYNSGWFDVHLAELNNEIVGIIFFYETYSSWKGRMLHLEDFVVSEKYRSQGIGQRLFDHFIDIAKQKKCKLVKWEVLDWNKEAIKFYNRQGATIEQQWLKGKIVFNQ